MSKEIQVRKTNQTPEQNLFLSDMDRFVDRFFADPFSPLMAMPKSTSSSRSEIRETNDAYILSAVVPGIPRDEISVEVSGNTLVVKAEHAEASESDQSSRRSYQSFHQSFALPTTVDVGTIEAHCEDGLLEVLIPKKASATAQKIAVQSGKGSMWSRLKSRKEENGKKLN